MPASDAESVEPPLETTCAAVKERLDADDQFVLLDCREQNEYDLVHLDGATSLPMSTLTDQAGELESFRERPIVVYCHHGGRSFQVATWLRQQGFSRTQSMAGGIDQWALEIEPGMMRY